MPTDINTRKKSSPKTKKRRRGRKAYVSNAELLEELAIFKEKKVYTEKLGEMILKMAEQISKRKEFRFYSYVDDMVTEAVLTCLKYLHNFDPKKNNNAFAYLSTIIFNSFKLFIKKEKKHSLIKDKALHLRLDEIEREISGNTRWDIETYFKDSLE